MSFLSVFIIVFYLELVSVDSARILAVFPTPSLSHQIVFRMLTEELVKRGHNLTVITTDPIYFAKKPPVNLKEIDVHNVSYNLWNNEVKQSNIGKPDAFIYKVNSIISNVVKLQLAAEKVQDILNKRDGDYDLLLLEAWVPPILIFSHIYKVPVIQISSFGASHFNLETVGAVTHRHFYPIMLHQKIYNLTTWEKIQQLYVDVLYKRHIDLQIQQNDDILQQFLGPNIPCLSMLFSNVHMVFVNHHQIWIENQPVPSNAVFMGGIHKHTPKTLTKDLKAFLDDSKNGVIIFSLGTNVIPSNLPISKIQIFIKIFSQLPYKVLWKWDKDVLPGITSNINILKWLPQSDLLRHPNVKLFITQGGLQSTDEAIDAGVPLIGIPMLGDQWYNVAKYVRHKIGIGLNFETLTEDELRNAIMTVIDDKSYRDNIIRLRSLLVDQPQSPLERAVWWIEYLLRHDGATQLRAPGANITWMEYFELELLASVFLVLLCVLYSAFAGASITFNLLRNYIAKTKAN